MKISYVLAAYNVSRFLDSCFERLMPCVQPGDEIIIVNDGSTDDTRSHIVELTKRLPQLTLVDKPNGGISSTRNAGLKVASGDYVLFLDPDDAVIPEALQTARASLLQHRPDVLVTDYLEWPEDAPQQLRPSRQRSHTPGVVTHDPAMHLIETLEDCIPCTWTRFYRRGLFSDMGATPFPEWSMYDDLAAAPHLAARAHSMLYLPLATVQYRIRAGSLSQTRSPRSCTDMVASALHAVLPAQAFPGQPAVQDAALRFLARKWMDAVKLSRQVDRDHLNTQRAMLDHIAPMLLTPPLRTLTGLARSTRKDDRRAYRHLRLARLHRGLYARVMALIAAQKHRRERRR